MSIPEDKETCPGRFVGAIVEELAENQDPRATVVEQRQSAAR
jgi:hypothetical protein